MIEVDIKINGQVIASKSAKRVDPIVKEGETIAESRMCVYELDNGEKVLHRYGDGALALAMKMIVRMERREISR